MTEEKIKQNPMDQAFEMFAKWGLKHQSGSKKQYEDGLKRLYFEDNYSATMLAYLNKFIFKGTRL